jgi:hypothetical protein
VVASGTRTAMDGRDRTSAPIARAIRARLIQTSLERATGFDPSDEQAKAWSMLRERNFDQAPVLMGGVPNGYIRRADLDAGSNDTIAACVRPILPSSLVAGDAQFEQLLPWLASEGFLFVLDGRQVSGFVVPSDINKQAGRSYFYLLLAEIEIRLADLIRLWTRRQPEWLDPVVISRPNAAFVRRYRQLRAKNVEADLVAEMSLSDLFRCVSDAASLRGVLGYWTDSDWRDDTRAITHLRNRVMHSAKPILDDQRGLEELLVVDEKARALLGRLRTAEDGALLDV